MVVRERRGNEGVDGWRRGLLGWGSGEGRETNLFLVKRE